MLCWVFFCSWNCFDCLSFFRVLFYSLVLFVPMFICITVCRLLLLLLLLFTTLCLFFFVVVVHREMQTMNCFIFPLSPITHNTHSMEMCNMNNTTWNNSFVLLNEQCTNTRTFAKWILRDHRARDGICIEIDAKHYVFSCSTNCRRMVSFFRK